MISTKESRIIIYRTYVYKKDFQTKNPLGLITFNTFETRSKGKIRSGPLILDLILDLYVTGTFLVLRDLRRK